MGFDIQHYYALHQSLTLEDLAKASSKHTLKGLVKVINKVSTFLSLMISLHLIKVHLKVLWKYSLYLIGMGLKLAFLSNQVD